MGIYMHYIYIYRKGRNYMNEVELEVARESEREKKQDLRLARQ